MKLYVRFFTFFFTFFSKSKKTWLFTFFWVVAHVFPNSVCQNSNAGHDALSASDVNQMSTRSIPSTHLICMSVCLSVCLSVCCWLVGSSYRGPQLGRKNNATAPALCTKSTRLTARMALEPQIKTQIRTGKGMKLWAWVGILITPRKREQEAQLMLTYPRDGSVCVPSKIILPN